MTYHTLNNKRTIIADYRLHLTLGDFTTDVTEHLAAVSEVAQCQPCTS